MWAALGHVLPIAVAVALSSIPIMATILILLSAHRRPSSLGFLIGFTIGLIGVVVAFTLLAYVIPAAPPRRPQLAIAALLIVIGSALVVFACISWRRIRTQATAGMPKWLEAVGSMRAWSAFGLALLLNVRPKALLLSAAAGLSIRADDLTAGEAAWTVIFYTLVSASSIAVPIISSWVKPEMTERRLVPARAWITTNSAVVSNLILIMVGVVIAGNGMGRL